MTEDHSSGSTPAPSAGPRRRGRLRKNFFFQAEDGIRDRNVTGVQTCALPISSSPHRRGGACPRGQLRAGRPPSAPPPASLRKRLRPPLYLVTSFAEVRVGEGRARSEERRVGKEWRSRRAGGCCRSSD